MFLSPRSALFALLLLPGVVLAQVVGTDPGYRLPELQPAPEAALREGATVFVKQIRVNGVTVLDEQVVTAAIQPYLDRNVSSAELQDLRQVLTQLYVDKGYVSSGVLLPDQDVKDGLIVYQAVEARLQRVDLVGGTSLRHRYVSGRLRRFVNGPLNMDRLQYALRYLEEDPNVRRLDAALRPGEQPGSNILRLSIDDEPRFSAGLSADNYRSTSTGAERGTVSFSSRNLTGFGEEFAASLGLSEGADERAASLSVPFMARNATMQLFYSESDADIIEKAFRELDIESESISKGAKLRFPFIENLDTQIGVTLGFEVNRSKTSLLGIPYSFSPGAVDGVSKTAVGSVQANLQLRSASSASALRVAYRHGFDDLDATLFDPNLRTADDDDDANPNWSKAGAVFTNFQAQATHIQRLNALPGMHRLGDRAQLVFRAAAQLSRDALLSLEKFAIGGVNTVRGVPESLLVRDNGLAATLELQLPIAGYRATSHPLNLVFAPFVDFGRSWDEADTDPGSDLRNTDDPRYIVTAGLGALWQPWRSLSAQVFWGREIASNFAGDDPRQFRGGDLQDHGIHFSFNYVARW